MAGNNSITTALFLKNNWGAYFTGSVESTNNIVGLDCDQIKSGYNIVIAGVSSTGLRLPSQNQISGGPTTTTTTTTGGSTTTTTTTGTIDLTPDALYAGVSGGKSYFYSSDKWYDARRLSNASHRVPLFDGYIELLTESSDTRNYGCTKTSNWEFARASATFNLGSGIPTIATATFNIYCISTLRNVALVINTGTTNIPLDWTCYYKSDWDDADKENWLLSYKTSLSTGWNSFTIPSTYFYSLEAGGWQTFSIMDYTYDWLNVEPSDTRLFELTIDSSHKPYLSMTQI